MHPPQIYMSKPQLSLWWYQEVKSLGGRLVGVEPMMGLVSEEEEKRPTASPLCPWAHQGGTVCRRGRGPHQNRPCRPLTCGVLLRWPELTKTERDIIPAPKGNLEFISHQLHGFYWGTVDVKEGHRCGKTDGGCHKVNLYLGWGNTPTAARRNQTQSELVNKEVERLPIGHPFSFFPALFHCCFQESINPRTPQN